MPQVNSLSGRVTHTHIQTHNHTNTYKNYEPSRDILYKNRCTLAKGQHYPGLKVIKTTLVL